MSNLTMQSAVRSGIPTGIEFPVELPVNKHESENPKSFYSAINDGCIRLITLLPGDVDSPLSCSLRTVKLLEFDGATPIAQSPGLPNFESISYTWGGGERGSSINCDGCPLRITQNLSDGLKCLRYTEDSRILWVDGICINQNDVEERERQVRMMGLIYWRAQKVLVWLGQDDEEDERWKAANAITLMYKFEKIGRQKGKVVKDTQHAKRYRIEGLNERDNVNDWEALRRLLNRKWFTRAWAVQELGLAKEALFHCGGVQFDLDTLREAYSFMVTEANLLIDYFRIDFQMLTMAFAYQDSTRYGARLDLGNDPCLAENFLDILDMGKSLESTNPKDKIYAFLGHPSAFKKHLLDQESYDWYSRNFYLKGRSTIVQPDYKEDTSVPEIYFQLARSFIQNFGLGPDLLGHVAHDEESIKQEFPSWVPRWDKREKCRFPYYPQNRPQACFAFSSMPAKIELNPRTNDLHLRALHLSKVQYSRQLPAACYFSIVPSKNAQSTDGALVPYSNPVEDSRVWIRKLCSSLPNSHVNDAVSFASTLTAHLPEQNEESLQLLRNFDAYRRMKARNLHSISPEDKSWSIDEDESNANLFLTRLQSAAPNRALFITYDGRLGLGPRITSAEDEVWLPVGSPVPVVLRPTVKGRFKVLGQAYLYGVMKGEAVKDLKETSFQDTMLC